ncbi:hypothetical protein [Chitinophaga sp. CB10]|uniref:hypothetical protein n=1 Tax=Chitinophaga sp. CB10 TaxID=1891659 RepID=UPI0025C53638|nr:hypothetical protein [Chitinophaga sp. CB10]
MVLFHGFIVHLRRGGILPLFGQVPFGYFRVPGPEDFIPDEYLIPAFLHIIRMAQPSLFAGSEVGDQSYLLRNADIRFDDLFNSYGHPAVGGIIPDAAEIAGYVEQVISGADYPGFGHCVLAGDGDQVLLG